MIEALLKFLLKRLYGITSEQWAVMLDKVLDLADEQFTGNVVLSANMQRASEFVAWFKTTFGEGRADWIIDTVRNLVVTFARMKGWIEK